MIEITMIFCKRVLFSPEYASTDQAWMTQYMSMLKKRIREFVTKTQYRSLAELQSNAMRREIKLEIQTRENEEEVQKTKRRPVHL